MEAPAEERKVLIDPGSKLPKYVQILNWVHGMISRGKLKMGDQIPTEEDSSTSSTTSPVSRTT